MLRTAVKCVKVSFEDWGKELGFISRFSHLSRSAVYIGNSFYVFNFHFTFKGYLLN